MPEEGTRGRVWEDLFPEYGGKHIGMGHRIGTDEFGRHRYVKDVFVSRKIRRNSNSPFAFVRFNKYVGASEAIQRLNGRLWDERKLFITLSKFERDDGSRREANERVNIPRQAKKIVQKWVEVKKVMHTSDKTGDVHVEKKT
ncbi:hypothetical protein PIB30_070810 [Stylosanthes scabra]|uniref:RRM domain-containing protein n=1 Tax=Stylosanthes scabra TaxID=79078 RepID=A0ABU6RP51_9FABA|nr:hypothetical protein [Stylosanthes scabra]